MKSASKNPQRPPVPPHLPPDFRWPSSEEKGRGDGKADVPALHSNMPGLNGLFEFARLRRNQEMKSRALAHRDSLLRV